MPSREHKARDQVMRALGDRTRDGDKWTWDLAALCDDTGLTPDRLHLALSQLEEAGRVRVWWIESEPGYAIAEQEATDV